MKTEAAEKGANRKEALDRAILQIEKSYGKGAVMHLDAMSLGVVGISTGALGLDIALGGQGFPRGRIVELFGPESSGKTTVALHTIASAQSTGGVCAFVDAEHALDPTWAKKCGVKLEHLLVSQPNSGEEALEIAEMLIRSNAIDVLVIDSVAALIPKAEIEGEMGQPHVALQARLMSQALRKLTAAISKTGTVMIFINQVRMKIGVMFGNPETTPGGKALKFYSSVRLDVRRISTIKEGEKATGNLVKAKVVKNKVAAPFQTAEFEIMFDSGISREGDLIDLGLKAGVVNKTGAWLGYGDVRLGQGRENAKQFLKDNPDLFNEVREKILAWRKEQDEAEVAKKNPKSVPAAAPAGPPLGAPADTKPAAKPTIKPAPVAVKRARAS
ncbi:MAG: recombinase RecA [Phycisphaerales bacterium]|nr:recombinase RecA [Phycisphaerales bacterium]